MRMSNVADSKVQKVTGHLTMKMTEKYTHFDTRQFTEIMDVQAELLSFNEPEKAAGKREKPKPEKKQSFKKKASA